MSEEEYIIKHFRYRPDGTITRDDRKNSNGSYDKDGYLILKVKGKQYKAHRIVWLLNYGSFPISEIDHINRIKTDNRIENLRESNRRQQNLNKNLWENPETGKRGIHITHLDGLKKKYTTKINGKTYRFYTLKEAIIFRKEKLNGYI